MKRQTCPDIEHIVVDGGSTDKTLAIIRKESPDSTILSGPDRGIYDALNKGIGKATGEVISILHGDDFFSSADVLEKVREVFENPGIDSCYGDLVYVADEKKLADGSLQSSEIKRKSSVGSLQSAEIKRKSSVGSLQSAEKKRKSSVGSLQSAEIKRKSSVGSLQSSEIKRKSSVGSLQSAEKDKDKVFKIIRYWKSGEYDPQKFYWGWMPPHPTFFVRREVYEKCGVFNLGLGTAADYELMLRFLVKHKITCVYIPEVLVKMRVGGVSNVSWENRIEANRMDRKAWEVNGLKPYPWTLWLKPVRKIHQWIFPGTRLKAQGAREKIKDF